MESFTSIYNQEALQFYSLILGEISWKKSLQGTEVIITRVNPNSKHIKVYGSSYNTDLLGDNDKIISKAIILLNQNKMVDLWNRNATSVVVYDNVESLQRGDYFYYISNNIKYSFKVTDSKTFGDANAVLFSYEVIGSRETKTI